MASDGAELRAAVYANPSDDAPRSVYADFLQERGDRYGHFIAAQLRGDLEAASEDVRAAMRASPLPFYRELSELPLPSGGTARTDARLRAFDRGFLRATSVLGNDRKSIDAEGWELIEWLAIAAPDAGNFIAAIASRLTSLRGLDAHDWRAAEALAHFRPRPLRSLTVRALEEWFDLSPLIDEHTTLHVELFGLLELWKTKRDGAWLIELETLGRVPVVPNAPLERALQALVPRGMRTEFTWRNGASPLVTKVRSILERLGIVPEERPLLVVG